MSTGVWWRGHSEIRCCSCVEGLEPGDRLEHQEADKTEKKHCLHCVMIISHHNVNCYSTRKCIVKKKVFLHTKTLFLHVCYVTLC